MSAAAAAAQSKAFAAKMQLRSNMTDEQLALLLKSANATKLDVKMGELGLQKTDQKTQKQMNQPLLGLISKEEDRGMPWRELFLEAAQIAAQIRRPFFGLQSALVAIDDINPDKAEGLAVVLLRCVQELSIRYRLTEGTIMQTLEKATFVPYTKSTMKSGVPTHLYLALLILQKLNEFYKIAEADAKIVRHSIELEECFVRQALVDESRASRLSDSESADALQLMTILIEHPKLSIVSSVPEFALVRLDGSSSIPGF